MTGDKVITRSAFDALSPIQKAEAAKTMKIVDGPSEPVVPTITKRQYDAMPAAGRALFTGRGGVVAEDETDG
jgi:hypothetical protein